MTEPVSSVVVTAPVAQPPVAQEGGQASSQDAAKRPDRALTVQPVLEKLFALYPHLFGAEFLPLKLGIYQELLAKHPVDLPRDALKVALGVHTRSTRYLQCVAAGKPRHDLDGNAGDPVAPEHIYFALLEIFRRRQNRAREDLRPKFRSQLIEAFEASGLSRQDYMARVQNNDAAATLLLTEALDERDQKVAKQEALLRAYDASGKSPAEFADMYGLRQRDIDLALAQRPAPHTG
ncbi:MAG: ProQ/FINO family protein [Burkholderiaceae bacterium]